MSKLRVLFVAGLKQIPGGASGGQLTAAATLLESGLAHVVNIVTLSSTMSSIPPPPMRVRAMAACRRVGRFFRLVLSVDVVLVFTSNGLSLLEKGLMCMVARTLRRGVVVRFSSGHLPEECKRSFLLAGWLRLTLRSAHVVCAQGHYWSVYFNHYPEASGKVMQIANGIALGPRLQRPSTRCGPPRIAFVGWIDVEKGVFDALDVLKAVHRSHPSTTLTVAGGGRDLDEFRKRVRSEGLEQSVSMLGWIPKQDVDALLANCDVFLFPSHAEGLPNAVLEAMAASLPVVATRVGSVPDVIEDGTSGFLTDVGDCRAMAEAISSLLSDQEFAASVGANARLVVESRFDVQRVWPLYVDALHHARACARRHRPTARTRSGRRPLSQQQDRSTLKT